MTRISTVGQNDFLLTDIFNIQKRIADGTRQISSESKSTTYHGLALDVQALAAAKSIKSKSEQFVIAHRDLSRITNVQDLVLEGLSDIAKQLKVEMITASQPGGGVGFRTVIDNLYTDAVNLLNIKENGRFLFGGTRTDTAPVQSLLPANLEALGAGNHAQAFVNNSVKPTALIDDGLEITHGVIASEVATDLFNIFQDLMIAATASAGDFEKPLTDSERDFVISKFSEADTAFDTINLIQAQHGVAARLIEETAARHENEIVLVNKFIADIENINVAEAVSKLNNDQTALEASFRVFSQLNSLSLLRFI